MKIPDTWSERGMIMKTTNGGLVGVESFSSLVPSGFILNQNYPNPFNPSTVISYDLPYSDFVSLKVLIFSERKC
ncbi:MAG: hypothetical protein R3A12_01050 [Ignavibacteria bacterium]